MPNPDCRKQLNFQIHLLEKAQVSINVSKVSMSRSTGKKIAGFHPDSIDLLRLNQRHYFDANCKSIVRRTGLHRPAEVIVEHRACQIAPATEAKNKLVESKEDQNRETGDCVSTV